MPGGQSADRTCRHSNSFCKLLTPYCGGGGGTEGAERRSRRKGCEGEAQFKFPFKQSFVISCPVRWRCGAEGDLAVICVFQSAAAAPSPVMGNMPPNDAMPGGPMPPGFFQGPPGSQQSPHAQPPPHNPSNPMMGPHGQPFMSPRYPGGPRPSLRMPNQPGGIPGSQPLLPNSLDPTRPQGHPNMGGPMRMNPPRGMAMGPQNYGGMRPPPNSMGAYSSSSPGNYVGPPGGGGPPGTPIMPSPGDSTNSSENIYTMMNPIGPGGNRPNFPMGPGPDGPMGAMGAMEPHHMNGSLGSGDMDGLPKSSPNNMGGMNNPPGTPRDDGEMGGNFLNPFQSESYSPNMTMSV
uniref:Single stranded DNA binding protein 4 n=1 Tax=Poecilia reticulata TaxID=8081 RepID=A0A3P9NZB3_POERE